MSGVVGCDLSTKRVYIAELQSDSAPLIRVVPIQEDVAETMHRLRKMMRQARKRGACCLYIEQVFGYQNYMTAISLKRVATMLELAGAEEGLTVNWAHPSVWRKAVYGEAGRIDTKTRKQMALGFVAGRWPDKQITDHNEAEACLIALYGSLRESLIS